MDSKFSKADYGDWQTNYPLALSICSLLKRLHINPQVVIEPTCGKGSFILAALEIFDSIETIYGIEINPAYLDCLRESLKKRGNKTHTNIQLINADIFKTDFGRLKHHIKGKKTLVLGNPPWVTNSDLGKSGNRNLPTKTNFKHVKGLNAITGKGNFDIAEYIFYMMQKLLEGEEGVIAMLLKNSVAKNIIYEQRNSNNLHDSCQYSINAGKEFNVSTSASLFVTKAGAGDKKNCRLYDFYKDKYIKTYGWEGCHFVSDSDKYKDTKGIDGKSSLTWWSGLKHDCAKVLELSKTKNHYFNKLGEEVDVEDGIIYPFLKSSDLKEENVKTCRKYIVLTQHRTSDNTDNIRLSFPKAYRYLQEHSRFFEERKSSIYKNRPKFCLFGVGDYTFKKYRIAISGLYKQTRFSLISDIDNKQALLDDTTYLTGFDNKDYALLTLKLLNSSIVQSFINSIVFEEAKRPINKDLLMRIDLVAALDCLGKDYFGITDDQLYNYKIFLQSTIQTTLF